MGVGEYGAQESVVAVTDKTLQTTESDHTFTNQMAAKRMPFD